MITCVSVLSERVLILVLKGSEYNDNCTVDGDRMILKNKECSKAVLQISDTQTKYLPQATLVYMAVLRICTQFSASLRAHLCRKGWVEVTEK